MGKFLIGVKKNFSSVSAQKLKCPSSARIGSELSQLGLARAGKFQLEPITTVNDPSLSRHFVSAFKIIK